MSPKGDTVHLWVNTDAATLGKAKTQLLLIITPHHTECLHNDGDQHISQHEVCCEDVEGEEDRAYNGLH